jgi:predicted DCC family thiol-disulfide oxidoreductase YuxK
MSQSADGWEVEVFFDGECPLCRREIGLLRRLDLRRRIRFTDFAVPEFDPAPLHKSHAELMEEIHGQLPDGTVITGVEVFRRLYGAVGLRWVMPLTRLPGVSHLLDYGYRVFARNRLNWTGRCRTGDRACPLPPARSTGTRSAASPPAPLSEGPSCASL